MYLLRAYTVFLSLGECLVCAVCCTYTVLHADTCRYWEQEAIKESASRVSYLFDDKAMLNYIVGVAVKL